MTPAEMFFALVCGHAVADYALQSDFIAKGKNRHHTTTAPPGQKWQPVWPLVLSAHGLIHGTAVYIVTGIWWLGQAETVAHCLIDFGKCEAKYGIYTDQGLHIACKVLWVLIALVLGPMGGWNR